MNWASRSVSDMAARAMNAFASERLRLGNEDKLPAAYARIAGTLRSRRLSILAETGYAGGIGANLSVRRSFVPSFPCSDSGLELQDPAALNYFAMRRPQSPPARRRVRRVQLQGHSPAAGPPKIHHSDGKTARAEDPYRQ